ncbi:MAG TPA: ABC transporter substrate-binding protein [Candidatus Angelobacter sp.]
MPEVRIVRRVVSLQPSITVTLRDLGLLRFLAACTRYCLDLCPELKNAGLTIVQDSWSASVEQIRAARPDLVIASVPYQPESLAEIMKSGVPCLCLSPRSLADVYKDTLHIARIMGAEHRGLALVARMEQRIEATRRKASVLPRPLVYCEEWGKPLILSQPWVAELVEAAGGRFFGQPGKQVTEEEAAAADPAVIVAAWCGAGNRVPLEKIAARSGWNQTRAVRSGRVYCINDEFLNTPTSTLLQGLQALGAAIHPEVFGQAPGLRQIETSAPLPEGRREELPKSP